MKARIVFMIGGISVFLIMGIFCFDGLYGILSSSYKTEPRLITEWYALFSSNSTLGLFRLSFFDMPWMLLLIVMFLSLYEAISIQNKLIAKIGYLLILVRIGLYISNNVALSMKYLADQYNQSTNEVQKQQLLGSGYALLAIDQGTGKIFGVSLFVFGSFMFSVLILFEKRFKRSIGIVGIIAHLSGFIAVGMHISYADLGLLMTIVIVVIASSYILWYALLGIQLVRMKE
jgi:hypothetical protein